MAFQIRFCGLMNDHFHRLPFMHLYNFFMLATDLLLVNPWDIRLGVCRG